MLIPKEESLIEITLSKAIPLTTAWSRLEGRSRTDNFDKALKAEVRDAMWMLTRQWQVGEFEAEDAGSPVVAKISTSTSVLEKYQAGQNKVQAFNTNVPFEAKVEQRPFPFSTLNQELSLDLRLVMGRRWMQLLASEGLASDSVKRFFRENYGFKKPDPKKEEDAAICAHPEVWQQFSAVAGRMIDGAKLYFDLKSKNTPHYYDHSAFQTTDDRSKFDRAEKKFKSWFEDLFYQPTEAVNDAWEPSRLEYQFSISTKADPEEKVLHAEEYYHGHLDWYNLDVANQTKTLGELPKDAAKDPDEVTLREIKLTNKPKTIIPAPVMFEGMPNARWWAFEDSRVNFSHVKPDSPDLPKLLMIEFGLIYANDWYLIPYTIPVGTLTKINGLTLTNSFGENFWIEAAGKGVDNDWTRWNMFSMNVDDSKSAPADTDLLLLPTVAKIQESKPVEEVVFIRDEMANMVWAIETIIPLANGMSKSGFEAAAEYHGFLQSLVNNSPGKITAPPLAKEGNEEAKIRYELMNTIPENWIPFIPTHVKGETREVQIQRGAMPRMLEGKKEIDKIRPRTSLLQVGLPRNSYYIHEEEVPRSGIRVEQSYQRTRSSDGKVFVWFGVHKTTGRGEGSSGLGFDRIIENAQK